MNNQVTYFNQQRDIKLLIYLIEYRALLKIQISSQLLCYRKYLLLTYQTYAALQIFFLRLAFGRTLNF